MSALFEGRKSFLAVYTHLLRKAARLILNLSNCSNRYLWTKKVQFRSVSFASVVRFEREIFVKDTCFVSSVYKIFISRLFLKKWRLLISQLQKSQDYSRNLDINHVSITEISVGKLQLLSEACAVKRARTIDVRANRALLLPNAF